MQLPEQVDLNGVPDYINSWTVARVPNFVPAILQRWQRNHVSLPKTFHLLLCPLAELNSHGGLPRDVQAITDPRLTCKHFTGCHRPYFAAIFPGAQADAVCQQVLEQLPWSEAYQVNIQADRIVLDYFGATEDIDEEDLPLPDRQQRSVQSLLENGELLEILA